MGGRELKYKAIIFDLFGTLVDSFTFREHERVLSEMAVVLSAPPDDFIRLWLQGFNERVLGTFGNTEGNIEHVCRMLGLRPEVDQILTAARLRLDFSRSTLIPRAGAVETVAQLKSMGYKIGLISDCTSETPILWNEIPFAPLVDVPIFSCVVGLKKPDPRIYKLACEQLAVMPEDCLYVGDGGSHELTGASGVGMHPVLIRDPNEDGDAYRVDGEGWQGPSISTLEDILTLVDQP